MAETTYSIIKRTSPDGKFTQYGWYEGTYFVAVLELPAESFARRLKTWHEDPRNASTKKARAAKSTETETE